MTKDAMNRNWEEAYQNLQDWATKVHEVLADRYLTEEEQQEKLRMLNQRYGGLINDQIDIDNDMKIRMAK